MILHKTAVVFFRLFAVLAVILIPAISNAQEVQMADAFRDNGKIYVVVAVVVTILLGILLYIFQTERKLKRIEDEVENLKNKK